MSKQATTIIPCNGVGKKQPWGQPQHTMVHQKPRQGWQKQCERQRSTNGDNGEALATPWHSSANGHCRGSIWQKGKTAECQVGLAQYCHTAQQAVTAPLQMTGAKL